VSAEPLATERLDAPGFEFDLGQPFGLPPEPKDRALLSALNALTAWHRDRCEPYRNIVDGLFSTRPAETLADVPFIPVRLFKTRRLASVPAAQVIKTLTSSGTTGQAVSQIFLDKETSLRQTRALTAIMASFLGRQRLPMVVVDSLEQLKDKTRFSARTAGILGFSIFGREHLHCLDADLELKLDELSDYVDRHRASGILWFGFTFIVWQKLVLALRSRGQTLDAGAASVMIHGGGWKRLTELQVNNPQFKSGLLESVGIGRVHNYYGMVEQVGSIFMECEHGHLHAPGFADVIIRDPLTLAPVSVGATGLIQVLSAIPVSYPGHSLLTEDVGRLLGHDGCPCGRRGRFFEVLGRMAQAELRGCSDTRAA
jgi:hypothetical protein